MALTTAGLATQSNAATKEERALQNAVKSYDKYIRKAAAKNCNPQALKLKGCQREVAGLDKRYEKFSEAIKSADAIVALKSHHDQLKELVTAAERISSINKFANMYHKQLVNMETRSCVKQEAYRPTHSRLCQQELIKADKIKGTIPVEFHSEPVIAEMITRHEAMRGMPEFIQATFTQNHNAMANWRAVHGDFNKQVNRVGFWDALEKGKARTGGKLDELDSVNKRLAQYKSFAADCKGKYADYVAQVPEKQQTCELAENADEYARHFAAATYTVALNRATEKVQRINARLENEGKIDHSDYLRYVAGIEDYAEELTSLVIQSHKAVNLAVPSFSAFEQAIAATEAAMETAVERNDWDNLDITSVTDEIEDYAEQLMEKEGSELVKIARLNIPWATIKNDLGIPLRKQIQGELLVEVSGEDYCLIRETLMVRTYDGTGYEPITYFNFFNFALPAPCN